MEHISTRRRVGSAAIAAVLAICKSSELELGMMTKLRNSFESRRDGAHVDKGNLLDVFHVDLVNHSESENKTPSIQTIYATFLFRFLHFKLSLLLGQEVYYCTAQYSLQLTLPSPSLARNHMYTQAPTQARIRYICI